MQTPLNRFFSFLSLLLSLLIFSSCGGLAGSNSQNGATVDTSIYCNGPSSSSWTAKNASGSNQLTVSVSSTSVCSGIINLPCTSVTLCVPGSNHCQTISDVLVDTGSYGLRVFSEALPTNLCQALPFVTDGSGNTIAECAMFGSGNTWGPVVNADIQLGGENSVNTSIQVIHATFGNGSAVCSGAATGVSNGTIPWGINGILGVGLMIQDCGVLNGCGNYFTCPGGSCTVSQLAINKQVANPVALLSTDNNGVNLSLPSVGAGGASGVTGTLTLGIDTQANNAASGAIAYPADPMTLQFETHFNSQIWSHGFIDSGSNMLFFDDTSIATCGSYPNIFFCPSSAVNLSATLSGYLGTPTSSTVSFSVSSATSLLITGNTAFSNFAAPGNCNQGGVCVSDPTNDNFDWGLPFFFGRKVFVGIEGRSSPNLGTGPYWAY